MGGIEAVRLLGPFRSGPGTPPPYLAGREKEQSLFRAWGGAVARGVPPPSAVILYGPRGNGKTALLAWLERQLAAIPGVEVVEMTPAETETPMQLAEQLAPPTWWAGPTPEELSRAGIARRRSRGLLPPTVEEALRLRACRRPLAFLLDEAHTLAPEVGRALLRAGRQTGVELPFLFVLAGTPDLEDRLSEMEASFWGRSEVLRINRLEPEAVAAAIERPLHDQGMSIESAALERIARESDGYPFFVQLWAGYSWEHAATEGRRAITVDEVAAAAPQFEARRGDYYRLRYVELEKRELLPAARAVAEAFGGRSTLSPPEVEETLLAALGRDGAAADPGEAMTALKHLGFIWRPGPTPDWEPGIPSLMDYLREHAPAP